MRNVTKLKGNKHAAENISIFYYEAKIVALNNLSSFA
jgi:hypothetical protein